MIGVSKWNIRYIGRSSILFDTFTANSNTAYDKFNSDVFPLPLDVWFSLSHKTHTSRIISLITGYLLQKRAEPDKLCVKYQTLHYVKINVTYLIYMQYIATTQISPKIYPKYMRWFVTVKYMLEISLCQTKYYNPYCLLIQNSIYSSFALSSIISLPIQKNLSISLLSQPLSSQN